MIFQRQITGFSSGKLVYADLNEQNKEVNFSIQINKDHFYNLKAFNPLFFLRMCLFQAILHTYPTIMKLGAVILYLKKIHKKYKLRDTPQNFCWHQHF